MDTALGWIGQLLAIVLDAIAWAPRWMGLDVHVSNAEPVAQILTVFIAIAISWTAVAIVMFLSLDWLALQVRLHISALTRPLGVEQTESTVRAAAELHLTLRVVASWFGSSGYRPEPDRDWLRPTVHSPRRRFAASAIGLALRIPSLIRRLLGGLWTLLTNRYALAFALATWWYLYRPPETAWTNVPEAVQSVIEMFSPSVAAAWITVLTALVAVLFTSVRWRGKTAWRVARYQQAHEMFNDLSLAAGRILGPLRDLIDARARDSVLALPDAVKELTAGRCYWDTDAREIRPSRQSFPGLRPMTLRDRVYDEAAPVRERLDTMAGLYRENALQSIHRELWQIAPRRVRSALFQLRYAAAGVPWSSKLSLLDRDWRATRVRTFVTSHSHLTEVFREAGAEPVPETITRATIAVRRFADRMHDEISEAFWAYEEIGALAEAGRRHLAPAMMTRVLDRLRPRS